jgi:hypothetical protein
MSRLSFATAIPLFRATDTPIVKMLNSEHDNGGGVALALCTTKGSNKHTMTMLSFKEIPL